MSLAGIAKSNQQIFEQGWYEAPSGRVVRLAEQISAATDNTRLYRPEQLATALDATPQTDGPKPSVQVVEGKTGESARQLALEVSEVPLALNFASAKNPGGGYVRGARAQEEDLARCSALHPTQLGQREYYDVNRAHESLIYTDYMIYSPAVPFFRDERYALLEQPTGVSIITAPAPNAGEVLRRDSAAGPEIERALRRRAGMVLAVAQEQSARHLVLGAWGCGVFRNDPAMVADAFGLWLEGPRFAGAFDRVVFAIYARGRDRPTLDAFKARFEA